MKSLSVFLAAFAAWPAFAVCPKIVCPADSARVPLQSAAKKAYFALPDAERRAKFADGKYRAGMTKDGCKPEAVSFSWTDGEAPFAVRIVRADESVFFATNLSERAFSIRGFEVAGDYRWTVTDRNGSVARSAFSTEGDTPRFLDGGQVPNVRDLGGRIGLDGRRIRQNMIIRSAGLNENAHSLYTTDTEALSGPDGEVKRSVITGVRALAAKYRPFVSKPSGELPMPRLPLPTVWRVSKFSESWPEGRVLSTLQSVRSPDDRLADAAPVDVTIEKDGFIRFPERGSGMAVLVAEIVSDKECALPVRVAGDWFWAMAVNGTVIRNYIVSGNGIGDVTKPSHSVLLPLREGRNLVTVGLNAGSVGWSFVICEDPEAVPAKALSHELSRLSEVETGILRREKGFLPGETRISDANRSFWLETLRIRTDIDLRSDYECRGMTGSPLGPSVNWVHVSSSAYAGMGTGGRKSFPKVFRVFLDPANYPIDFHCIAGQDRTGAVAYILNALLGVDAEELAKDWEATGFWNPHIYFTHEKLYDNLVRVFDAYPGETPCERVEAYVKDIGFTDADIAKFRSIMLEPK